MCTRAGRKGRKWRPSRDQGDRGRQAWRTRSCVFAECFRGERGPPLLTLPLLESRLLHGAGSDGHRRRPVMSIFPRSSAREKRGPHGTARLSAEAARHSDPAGAAERAPPPGGAPHVLRPPPPHLDLRWLKISMTLQETLSGLAVMERWKGRKFIGSSDYRHRCSYRCIGKTRWSIRLEKVV